MHRGRRLSGIIVETEAYLCRALRIDKSLDGEPLVGEIIFIEQAGRTLSKEEIGAGPRIGVDYAGEVGEAATWPLRFFWKGNPCLSRKEQNLRRAKEKQ